MGWEEVPLTLTGVAAAAAAAARPSHWGFVVFVNLVEGLVRIERTYG